MSDDIAAALARIRKTLEERTAEKWKPSALATYDTRALGKLLRPKLDEDPRGWRACAAEIGVTMPDLSRICAGQTVSAAKVFAVADWLGINARDFYRPVKRKRFTGNALKQKGARR
jgi:hypothetical protein